MSLVTMIYQRRNLTLTDGPGIINQIRHAIDMT